MAYNVKKLEQKALATTVKHGKYMKWEDDKPTPVLVTRRPDVGFYCTEETLWHEFDLPGCEDGQTQYVPCAGTVQQPCVLCQERNVQLSSGAWATMTKAAKKVLKTAPRRFLQLVKVPLDANVNGNPAAMKEYLEGADLFVWKFSPEVHGLLTEIITGSTLMFKELVDPTDPNSAVVLWVTRQSPLKTGKDFPTFKIQAAWNQKFEIPEKLMERVRPIDDIQAEMFNLEGWSSERILGLLGMGPQTNGPKVVNGAATPKSMGPAPEAPKSIPFFGPPSDDAPAGETTIDVTPPRPMVSAGTLACLGVNFRADNRECQLCPRKQDCLSKMMENAAKLTAPATASVPTPPGALEPDAMDKKIAELREKYKK